MRKITNIEKMENTHMNKENSSIFGIFLNYYVSLCNGFKLNMV